MVMVLTAYPVLAFFVPKGGMDWVARIYAVVFVSFGFFIFYWKVGSPTIVSDISVAFFGVYIIFTGAYVRAHIRNKQRADIQMNVYTSAVMPMLKYDAVKHTMIGENSEPIFFFMTMFCVIIWALVSSILSRAATRWMPLMVLSLAFARTFIFIVEKSYRANTAEGRSFLQASLQFYVEALDTAIKNKIKWRNQHYKEHALANQAKAAVDPEIPDK
jgi:hypothetical protein